MNPFRRSFLALLASAPIAALAPLPTFLPRPFHGPPFELPVVPTITNRFAMGCLAPGTMAPMLDYARRIQCEIARDTLGCDSLDEFLERHPPQV